MDSQDPTSPESAHPIDPLDETGCFTLHRELKLTEMFTNREVRLVERLQAYGRGHDDTSGRDVRKALYAQQAGASGILFVRDVHNHEAPVNFTDVARQSWPNPPRRIPRYVLADWADRVGIPAATVSPALAEPVKTSRDSNT